MKAQPRRVFAVSLGCPKNRVDTEVILGDILSGGGELVGDPAKADVIIVNTCGFLESARQESIETLAEMVELSRRGAKVVAAGCMAQAFGKRILEEVPGVAMLSGVRDLLSIRPRLDGCGPTMRGVEPDHSNPRLLTTGESAYLKIADGCSRQCAFCIIPKIKGRQFSRQPDDIIAEARALASIGVRELVLVAQDLTHYGTDLPGDVSLAGLVRRLDVEVDGIDWIRLMYLFPRDIDDDLLSAIANSKKVLRYLDIPVQHGDDGVLSGMRRGTTSAGMVRMFGRIRDKIPGVVLRTTFLVGFPGEDSSAFDRLLEFANGVGFDLAGVFGFSPEPGSRAAKMGRQVLPEVVDDRIGQLEILLAEQAHRRNAELVGTVHEAIMEAFGSDEVAWGRLWFQAPDIDGMVRVSGVSLDDGTILKVRIVAFDGADFSAEVVRDDRGV